MLSFQNIILLLTVMFSGLVAGLFYAYSCSVNPGLNALPDSEYLKAMQSINRAIQNPYFFCSFMGLLILLPVSCKLTYGSGSAFYVMLTATAMYFILVFGVTIAGNVPLNNRLEAFTITDAGEDQITALRRIFEKPWNRLNLLRTVASIVSFGLCILSVMLRKS